MSPRTVAGYVLAGGQSTRMGTDKSRLNWRGGDLIDHVASEVESATGAVTIVGGDPRPQWRVIPDLVAGFGPVAGIAAALRDSPAEWTLIVACDMPFVDRAWLRRLIESAEGQVLIPRTHECGAGGLPPTERIHPLCALWHASAQERIAQAVADGVHTVREAIRPLDCRWFDLDDARPVSNVNTPEEWARVRE